MQASCNKWDWGKPRWLLQVGSHVRGTILGTGICLKHPATTMEGRSYQLLRCLMLKKFANQTNLPKHSESQNSDGQGRTLKEPNSEIADGSLINQSRADDNSTGRRPHGSTRPSTRLQKSGEPSSGGRLGNLPTPSTRTCRQVIGRSRSSESVEAHLGVGSMRRKVPLIVASLQGLPFRTRINLRRPGCCGLFAE